MAGEWIPMRIDLADDPAVISIALTLGMDEYAVVGRLHRLWVWANRHLTTGEAKGITESWVDRYVSAAGFAAALLAAGWLRSRSGGVEFPNFERWNSEGAKRRLEKTRQKQVERSRKTGDSTTTAKETIPRPLREAVFTRDGSKCVNCGWTPDGPRPPVGIPQFDRLSIDHVFPECRGGKTIMENLVTLCMKCNQTKSGRTFEEAGMSPNLSHILGDKVATRGEERKEEEKKTTRPPDPPKRGGKVRAKTRDVGDQESDPRFLRFWAAYPKKVGKIDAAKVFAKIDPSPELLAAIFAGLESWKHSHGWIKDGGQFIKNAQGWLTGRMWEETPPNGKPQTRGGFQTVADIAESSLMDCFPGDSFDGHAPDGPRIVHAEPTPIGNAGRGQELDAAPAAPTAR